MSSESFQICTCNLVCPVHGPKEKDLTDEIANELLMSLKILSEQMKMRGFINPKITNLIRRAEARL